MTLRFVDAHCHLEKHDFDAVAEILASDEHAVAMKPALDVQQAKALRLLTDVQPPQPPQPPKPPVPPERPEMVVVREAEAQDLDRHGAQAMLSDINAEMERDATLRLSIAWKLLRKGMKR